MLRRVIDLLLIAAILIAVGFGVYEIGTHVDSTSNGLARQDSELNQKVYTPTRPKGPSHRTIEYTIIAVAGAAGVMLLVSVGGTLLRGRRRQRWHAV